MKRIAKATAKSAVKTGLHAIKNASQGKSVKHGMKTNLQRAKKRIAEAALGENVQCSKVKKRKRVGKARIMKRKSFGQKNIFSA